MKNFLTYILESTFQNKEINKHDRKYLKNTIDQIFKTQSIMLGKTSDDAKNVKISNKVIKLLKDIDISTIDVDSLNNIFQQNDVPFKWNNIFKSNLYKGSAALDDEVKPDEMESCICLAFNTLNNTLNSSEKDMATEAENITEANSTTSNKVYNYYMSNKDKVDACAKPLFSVAKKNDRFDKLENEVPVSDEWIKLGKYEQLNNKPNKTAKTDIISSSGKCRISLKKETGARLMSGKQSEAIATIRTALYRTFGKKENICK